MSPGREIRTIRINMKRIDEEFSKEEQFAPGHAYLRSSWGSMWEVLSCIGSSLMYLHTEFGVKVAIPASFQHFLSPSRVILSRICSVPFPLQFPAYSSCCPRNPSTCCNRGRKQLSKYPCLSFQRQSSFRNNLVLSDSATKWNCDCAYYLPLSFALQTSGDRKMLRLVIKFFFSS